MLSVPFSRAVVDSVPEDLALTPGVRVRAHGARMEVRTTMDLLVPVQRRTGATLLGSVEPKRDVDGSRLGTALLGWQREGAMALAEGRVRLLWWSCGTGKSLAYVSAADLVAPYGPVLFVTRALGRDVFARDSVHVPARPRIGIVIGVGPRVSADGDVSHTKGQDYAIARADRALKSYRDRGADCFAAGTVGEALDRGAWGVVVGWETLCAHEKAILHARFRVVVFDEHHCGKGYNSARTRAAHRIAAKIPIVWGGTATPVPDRVRDLWGQLYAVGGRAAWGTSLQFALRYCHAVTGRWGGYETDGPHRRGCARCTETTAELKERLVWWSDRRNRTAIAHRLPSITRAMVHVEGSGRSHATKDSDDEGMTGIEAAIARAADAKVKDVAVRAAEAIVAGERVVVAGNRRVWVPRMVKAIEAALPTGLRRDRRAWIRGATGADSRERRIALAEELCALAIGVEDGQYAGAALVVTTDCVRTSVDLFADRVIVAALPWTPEVLDQFEGRFPRVRFGPGHRVQIDYVIAQGTIDDAIEQTLLGKLTTLCAAGSEVDGAARTWLEGAQPTEAEVLAELHAWISAQRDVIARAEYDAEAG